MAPENTPRAGWVAREATEPRAGTTKVRQIALDMMLLIGTRLDTRSRAGPRDGL